ncbi:hypothetical protein ACFLR2_02235 [Chlamydiota bacterium]
MTSYLPDTRSNAVGNILYSPTAGATASGSTKEGGGIRVRDSVAQAQQEAQKASLPGTRPVLPSSNPQTSANEMMIIAEAFCKAYSSMNYSVTVQVKDYAEMQQLDQTQTKSVLDSTTNAINKQEAADKQAAAIQDYVNQTAEVDKIFGWVMFAVGIVLIVATAVSGIIDGGASEAALPEEIEMEEMLVGGADNTGEEAGEAAENVQSADDPTDADAGTGVNNDNNAAPQETQNEAMQRQEMERNLEKSNAQSGKSETTWKQKLGKFGLKTGVAAALGSPMLVKGIFGVQLGDKLAPLAEAQKIVGEALDVASRNNMYFQFLQQLLQREGGVVTEEVHDANEVVDTYASVTSALRGISYGLASTV